MEGSNLSFYRYIPYVVIICCVILLFSDFAREKADTVARFYTFPEVEKMLQDQIEKVRESHQEENRELEKNDKNKTEEQSRRKVVLIVTFMRSGSTFLGEMFNNHEDAFYIFEPVHPLARLGLSKTTLNDRLELISNNLNCKFEDKYDITIPWRSFKSDEMELEETLDKRGDFVFRSKHRRLCAPPFCAHDNNQLFVHGLPARSVGNAAY